MAIDYGQKRVGIAVTDPLKLIANALSTIHVTEVFDFLEDYMAKEDVECIVVGEPKQMNNKASESARFIEPFIKKLKKVFPGTKVERMDERFTSSMALRTMIDAGAKKKDRQRKELLDTISATIILQSYLETINK